MSEGGTGDYFAFEYIALAVSVFLAGAIPIAVRGATRRLLLKNVGDLLLAAATILPVVWALGGFLHFGAGLMPVYAFLWPLTILGAYSLGYLWSTRRHGSAEASEDATPTTVDDLLAAAVLEKARSLAADQKDQALLDLRASTNRLFHLIGMHDVRREIGRKALHAAQRLDNVIEESSILIDDLGWASHELGESANAAVHVRDGIRLLEGKLSDLPPEDQERARFLLVKAFRHLAAFDAHDLERADAHLAQATEHVEKLNSEARASELAGLQVARAFIVAEYIDNAYGSNAVFQDAAEEQRKLVADGIQHGSTAREVFERIGDVERAAKSAAIVVRLCEHLPRSRDTEASRAKLERLRKLAARKIADDAKVEL